MKAYWYERAGAAPDVFTFGEIPNPEPGPGEVRVKIAVSAVNPTDCKRRELGRELGKFDRIIPNNDGAGTIDAVGDGVDIGRIGERVWLFGAQANRPFGTAAEYCVVPQAYASVLPNHESFANGACLGVPAVTAHRALYADGDIDGLTVLISGGSGRVGRYATQMAKAGGATVIATAGSDERCNHVRSLGADYVFNYRNDDLVSRVLDVTDGVGVDRMVDVAFGANVAAAPQLIRANGWLTSYSSDGFSKPEVPFLDFMYKNIAIRPFSIYGMPENAKINAFRQIGELLARGRLSHRVSCTYPFTDMISAHQTIETADLFGVCLVEVAKVG